MDHQAKIFEDLRRSEEKFRLLVNEVKDYAIFILDPDGYVKSWNQGAKRLKGYEANEIIDQHFSRFYTNEDIDRGHPQEELSIAKETGRFEETGWRLKKDGSTFLANVVITALYDDQGNFYGFSKITRDMTEKKKQEDARVELEKLKATEAELQKAIQLREDFLSIASHELKTPLTPLSLQIQTLQRILKRNKLAEVSSEDFNQIINSCVDQIASLSVLIDELLDFSRISVGRLQINKSEFDLSQFVNDVSARFFSQAEQTGQRIQITSNEKIVGSWDLLRMEQVLSNLISNALKYGNKRGVEIRVWSENSQALISVRDHGIGIALEDQKKIFEKFERAVSEKNFGGLGLGLYIIRELVKLHGGEVSVQSALNQGATFTLSLPISVDSDGKNCLSIHNN